MLVCRTDRGESFVSLADLEQAVLSQLEAVHRGMYDTALSRRGNMTYTIRTLDEFRKVANQEPGSTGAMWCGSPECKEKLKDLAGVSPAVCLSSRNRLRRPVPAVGRKPKRWFTGERPTKPFATGTDETDGKRRKKEKENASHPFPFFPSTEE